MATTSAGVVGRSRGDAIEPSKHKTKRPGDRPGRCTVVPVQSAPVANQAEQHHEQVDEVEVKRQRAHYRLAAAGSAVVVDVVHLLDLLGVPGGQAGKHDDAD